MMTLIPAATTCTACHHLQDTLARVRDASLRHCLQFGVGLHHAGLAENDRQIVERLFVTQKIQVGAPPSLGKLRLPGTCIMMTRPQPTA